MRYGKTNNLGGMIVAMNVVIPKRALFLGRFQPFHNGHLAALRQIMANPKLKELIIGIGSAQASDTMKNPFTLSERSTMISRVLGELKPSFKTTIVAITDTTNDNDYVRSLEKLLPKFELVYSNNQLVQRLFSSAGYTVLPIKMVERDRWQGSHIRTLMASDRPWQTLVPPVVNEYLIKLKANQRLQSFTKPQ